MKKILLAPCAVVLINTGCDSNEEDVELDDVLRIINSLNLPDVTFRYKYDIDGVTISDVALILDSNSGPGSTITKDVALVDGSVFEFWADLNNFQSAQINCTVSAAAPSLGAVEVQVYTSGKGLVIECTQNWK